MKVIQKMDISVKITRQRGITLVPTFLILLIKTLQVHMSPKYKFICIFEKITKNIILVSKYC